MPTPRIAIGGISHESNTFAAFPTDLEQFQQSGIHRGEEIISAVLTTNTQAAGFVDAGRELRFELVPTLLAGATPGGTVTREAFESLLREMIDRIKTAGRLDGVLLSLHGAMVAEGYDDADGHILKSVREAVGPDVPISVSFDLHANMTPLRLENATIIVGYDTYPHVDCFDRGKEAAMLLHRMLQKEVHPVMAIGQPPLIPVPLAQFPLHPPMKTVMERTFEIERDPRILAVFVSPGFAYADVEHAGFSVVVNAERDRGYAQEKANEIANVAWELREGFRVRRPSPEEAVAEAIASPEWPVVLADVGDNVGGGSAGDGTAILSELMRHEARDAVIMIADPEAVGRAVEAGVGSTVTMDVGGKTDRLHGDPVTVTGRVRLLSDGGYRHRGPAHGGAGGGSMGRTAVLVCEGVQIILTERRTPPFSIQPLYSVGIDPAEQRILVVKAALAHRAAYDPITRRTIEVDTPGITGIDLSRFTFTKVRRPIFPLDEM
ncbi:MAG: M81 family metallopeptidase [Candidatus Latescibacteria bacterium]|nr:M81 family metallopeptidase [Candidatus Latescibacterota bacterium]